jgi:hypothetical protein
MARHEALPAGSEVERSWTRHVVRFMAAMVKQDSRRSASEVWTLLDLERELGAITRGFYGFGFVDRDPLRSMGVGNRGGDPVRAAAYLARNAARYLGGNVESAREGQELPGRRLRSYVSRRLTMSTRCTIRNLRRARYLYVCVRDSLPLPEWNPQEAGSGRASRRSARRSSRRGRKVRGAGARRAGHPPRIAGVPGVEGTCPPRGALDGCARGAAAAALRARPPIRQASPPR